MSPFAAGARRDRADRGPHLPRVRRPRAVAPATHLVKAVVQSGNELGTRSPVRIAGVRWARSQKIERGPGSTAIVTMCDREARAAAPQRRDAEGAAAPLPRGQLLRRPAAGHPDRARAPRGRHDPAVADRDAPCSSTRCSPRCAPARATTSRASSTRCRGRSTTAAPRAPPARAALVEPAFLRDRRGHRGAARASGPATCAGSSRTASARRARSPRAGIALPRLVSALDTTLTHARRAARRGWAVGRRARQARGRGAGDVRGAEPPLPDPARDLDRGAARTARRARDAAPSPTRCWPGGRARVPARAARRCFASSIPRCARSARSSRGWNGPSASCARTRSACAATRSRRSSSRSSTRRSRPAARSIASCSTGSSGSRRRRRTSPATARPCRYHAGFGDQVVSTGRAPSVGEPLVGLTAEPLLGSRPRYTGRRPPFRPDARCVGPAAARPRGRDGPGAAAGERAVKLRKALKLVPPRTWHRARGAIVVDRARRLALHHVAISACASRGSRSRRRSTPSSRTPRRSRRARGRR